MKLIQKSAAGKVEDVTEKGELVIGINHIGNEDSDGDISAPGSFDETFKDMTRIKWFLNHNVTQLLGVPVRGYEEDSYVKMVAQLNMKKQLSRDVLADYQLYAEHGKTLEHSVGVQAVARNKANAKEVIQWKMWEFSTLTHWGANEMTPLFGIKDAGANLSDQIQLLEQAIKKNYSEDRLKGIEDTLAILRKAIAGSLIVRCPYCGLVFDYASVPEVTLENTVRDLAARHAGWVVEDVVHEQMREQEPAIRAQVMEILGIKSMTKKSIEDLTNHVRCPKCYTRVFRHDAITADPEPEPAAEKGFFKSLGDKFLTK